MNYIPKDIISKVLLLFCIVVLFFSIRFINKQNSYSPIDEYAHMDYIEKLGEGNLPRLSDTICDELFFDVKLDSTKSLNGRINTREELGIGNYSYEAIHPPIYYSVLVIPNLVMKKMNFPIFKRLKVLRIFSYFIVVLGIFLSIPVFELIAKLGFSIPRFYGYACVLFGLLIISNHRYGLGNNMMSPFIINLTAIFLLKYYKQPKTNYLILFVSFSCISVFVAIGNLFLIPLLALIFIYKFFKHFSFKQFLIVFFIVFVFAFLFWQWKVATAPEKTINDNFQAILAYYIPAGLIDYATFIKLFSEDAFQLAFISDFINFGYVLLPLFFVNCLVGFLFFKTIVLKHKWVVVFAFLFVCFAIITFLLNKYVARIHWVGFRHYLGFIPVIYVSFSFWIVLLYNRFFKQPD
jgi:hypothetical protein